MDLLIRLIIWIIKSIAKEVGAANTRRGLAKEGIDPSQVKVEAGVSAAQIKSRLQAGVQRILAQVVAAIARGEKAADLADTLERDLGAIPGGRVMREIVREQIRPALDTHLPVLREARATATELPLNQALEQLQRDKALAAAHAAVHQAAMQAEVIAALRDTRGDPEDGYRLADADAIAKALLSPIQDFAAAHQLGLPVERPIAAPAVTGGEAIWMGLLPDRFPILFVPRDFLSDLYRYASVPHELGHLLWRDVPGLAREVHLASGFQLQRGMIAMRGGKLQGSLDQLYTAWMPEIFADFVAAMLLGPAAMRGLVHSFASPDRVMDALTAHAVKGQYDEHPPAHVRIHLVAHALWTMGFDQESNGIKAEWDKMHGLPERIAIPIEGGAPIQIGAEQLLESGREMIGKLYMYQYESIAGFRLADVTGFEMSPGLWARVQHRAELLIEDTPFNDNGRVVLAAAIEARAKHPGRAVTITRGLRRAILGRDAHERHVDDPAYDTRNAHLPLGWAEEVRAAMVLREVLMRRGGLARHRGRR